MPNNNRRNTSHRSTEGRSTDGRSNNARGGARSGSSRGSSTRNTSNSNRISSNNRSTSTSKPPRSNGGAIAVVVIMIVAIAAMGLFAWTSVSYLYDETTIIPGVEISGVDIGGLTRDQAYVELNNKLNENIGNLSVTLNYQGNSWAYSASDLNASGEISPIIDQVILYGHTGNLGQRLDEAEYVKQNAEPFNLGFEYDTTALKIKIEALTTEIEVEATEPMLVFDETAGKITGIEDRTALLYDPLRYDTQVNVNGAPADVYIDASGNYKIAAEIFSTTAGASGIAMDTEATYNAVIADLADDNIANVDIITTVVEPTLKEEDLFDYTSLVYHSKSSITSSSTYERDKNIDLALAAFDGMVIMPGEQVSFNETTGERSAENGFLEAPGIAQDKSLQLVYGGGVCQAATIMFNAALMAGCEILDKDSHSWPLYWQEGNYGTEARDAMVNWGTSDLVFKNTTQYPIYFDTYVFWKYSDNATHAYCNVYTKLLPDGQSIKYDPVLIETEETPEAEVISLTDTTEYADKTWNLDEESGLMVYKRVLSRPYKYYEVSQLIVDSTGAVVSERMWYKSQYNEITGVYYTKPSPD